MNTSLTIKARLGLTMAVLGLLLVLIGGLGLYGMNQTNVAYADTFTNQMPSAVAIESAELYAARERLVFDRAALAAGTPESAATLERGPMMRQRSNDEWAKYVALPMGDGEKALADTSYAKRMALQKVIDEGYEAVKRFKETAKSSWIGTKRRDGRRPLTEVKKWIKAVQPSQFYAKWPTDVDDDSVQIWYTGGDIT